MREFALLIVAALVLVLVPTAADSSHGEKLPRCYEDETLLIGKGDFSHGRWTSYECVHPENLTAVAKDAEYEDIGPGIRESICEHRRYWKRQHGIGPLVEEACH